MIPAVKLNHIYALILVIAVIHFSALAIGLYEGKVWIDIPLHFLGGILYGMIWLWLTQRPALNHRLGSPSPLFLAFSTVGFAAFAGMLWELFEFGVFWITPYTAGILKVYSATVTDVLSDLATGVLGGAFLALVALRKAQLIKTL